MFLTRLARTGARVARPTARGAAQRHAPVRPMSFIVEDHEGQKVRLVDKLLADRIVLVHDQITPALSNSIVMQLLYLESQDPELPIDMYINSPGGCVYSGLAIYDLMMYTRCRVNTFCYGNAMSMASILLAAGAEGSRHIMPNARVMIHQPLGGVSGAASHIQVHAEEILKTKGKLIDILSTHTGVDAETLDAVMERDRFFSSDEAVEFGIVDKVLAPPALADLASGDE